MIWLAARQFRAQTLTALGLLTAAAVYFLITGHVMHDTYHSDLASCTPRGDCDQVFRAFQQTYTPMFQLNQLLVVVVPVLIGIFWGAPLIGRELETGTHQLVWNQTITRSRWLATKVTIVGVAAMATAGLLSWMLTWWAGPLDHNTGDVFAPTGNRFAAMTFMSRDITPAAYAAFAVALGILLGLVLRRTLAAMAVTLVVFIGVQIVMPTLVRPNLLPSTTKTFAINAANTANSTGVWGSGGANFHFDLPIPAGVWVIDQPPVETASGRVAQVNEYQDCFPDLGGGPKPAPADDSIATIGACLQNYDLHESITYQPGNHYWPLQWIESGIFLVLAGLLTGTCFWWIRRRSY